MKRTIKLVIYYFIYQLAFTFLVTFVAVLIEATKSGGDLNNLVSVLQSGVIGNNPNITALSTILAAVMMMWHLLHFKYITFSTDYLRKENLSILLVSIPFIYTLIYLMNLMSEHIDLPNLLEDTFIDMSNNVWGIISMAIAAPILEECLFRGAIEGHLLKIWKDKPWAAIVVSGLVFGIVHMNPAQVLYASLIGLVLGWLRWRTGSIIPGIIGHILNNSLATLTMRLYGPEGCFEEAAGDSAQPYIIAAYCVILILCTWYIYKKTKKSNDTCNFSEVSNV